MANFMETLVSRQDDLLKALLEHVEISLFSLLIAILIAVPVAILLPILKRLPRVWARSRRLMLRLRLLATMNMLYWINTIMRI